MTVAFTGHRHISNADAVYAKLLQTITGLIQQGAEHFICGGAVGFDTLAAQAVLKLREQYPICLFLALPCEGQDAKFSAMQKATYEKIRASADREVVLYPTYQPGCMHARNRYMVDHCDLLVAYCHHSRGGTAYTVAYAEETGKTIIRL